MGSNFKDKDPIREISDESVQWVKVLSILNSCGDTVKTSWNVRLIKKYPSGKPQIFTWAPYGFITREMKTTENDVKVINDGMAEK